MAAAARPRPRPRSGRPGGLGSRPGFYLSPALPPQGVWVCQLLGFRNFPPEGSPSFKGTANEETGASLGAGRGPSGLGGSFTPAAVTEGWPRKTSVRPCY